MTAPMTIAAVVVVIGLSASFAGVAVRARLFGLVTMAVGSVAMLVTAGLGRPGTLGMTSMAAATLVGMLVFARALARLVAATGDEADRRGIDEARR